MIAFPNAKINLGLRITKKRQDGFHNIESLMLPVKFYDILEFTESKKDSILITGKQIEGDSKDNLIYKALNLIRKNYEIPALKIHLHKNIPTGAGLGGGSSDGAFMIKMLNNYFHLNISESGMRKIAENLGSDCSFFIRNTNQIAKGKGELLEEVQFSLPKSQLMIFNPGIHVSTKNAYSGISIKKHPESLKKYLSYNIEDWKDIFYNDFEPKVFKLYPEIKKLKDNLYQQGAHFASLTGSGGSVYGVFPKSLKINKNLRDLLIHKEDI